MVTKGFPVQKLTSLKKNTYKYAFYIIKLVGIVEKNFI